VNAHANEYSAENVDQKNSNLENSCEGNPRTVSKSPKVHLCTAWAHAQVDQGAENDDEDVNADNTPPSLVKRVQFSSKADLLLNLVTKSRRMPSTKGKSCESPQKTLKNCHITKLPPQKEKNLWV
jgi:hypothetical protein